MSGLPIYRIPIPIFIVYGAFILALSAASFYIPLRIVKYIWTSLM